MPHLAPAVLGAIESTPRTLQIRFANGAVVHIHRASSRRLWYALRPHIPGEPDWVPRTVAERQTYQRAAFDSFFCGVPYETRRDLDGDLYAVEVPS